jgi:hypothetical protein
MPRELTVFDHLRDQRRIDPDARDYIERVERAERMTTESAVRMAINDFVVGCKLDGTWRAIKACCILAGARTLTGALVPLVGAAPTNFNFAAGDYDRRTGLLGDGTSKYLNSNRNANADPQNNHHMALFGTIQFNWPMAVRGVGNSIGAKAIVKPTGTTTRFCSSQGTDTENAGPSTVSLGDLAFMGLSRSASGSYTGRAGGSSLTITQASGTPLSLNIFVFCANAGGTPTFFTTSRLRFYAIGEALDLALLDARVSELMNRISAAAA